MKLSRQTNTRFRGLARGPSLAQLLPGLVALLLLVLLVAAWVKGGEQPIRPIEQPVPDSRLAR